MTEKKLKPFIPIPKHKTDILTYLVRFVFGIIFGVIFTFILLIILGGGRGGPMIPYIGKQLKIFIEIGPRTMDPIFLIILVVIVLFWGIISAVFGDRFWSIIFKSFVR